jgi:hypothetical protein
MKILLSVAMLFALGCVTTDQQTRAPRQNLYDYVASVEQSRRVKYLAAHPDTSEQARKAIESGSVCLGMTPDEAKAAIGEPLRVNRTVTATGTREQWVYGERFLVYFTDGKLDAWQD